MLRNNHLPIVLLLLGIALNSEAETFDAQQVSAGGYHTCAVTLSGGIECWGRNWEGQLGDGDNYSHSALPVETSLLETGMAAVSSGSKHTCAVSDAGNVYCWGRNEYGQLGNGFTGGFQSDPGFVVGLPLGGMHAVASGDDHTCATTIAGAVWCWGRNNRGQLGNGTDTDRNVPVAIDASGSHPACGANHSCVIGNNGLIFCWGYNNSGQLGDDNGSQGSLSPVLVTGSGVTYEFVDVTAGTDNTCAITTTGASYCWGSNSQGQLGTGADSGTNPSDVPLAVEGLGSGTAQLAAGNRFSCAVTDERAALCWGNNDHGELGNGSDHDAPAPALVSGLDTTADSVTSGRVHGCAVRTDDRVVCWGGNEYGQLGDGTLESSLVPVYVPEPAAHLVGVVSLLSLTAMRRSRRHRHRAVLHP